MNGIIRWINRAIVPTDAMEGLGIVKIAFTIKLHNSQVYPKHLNQSQQESRHPHSEQR